MSKLAMLVGTSLWLLFSGSAQAQNEAKDLVEKAIKAYGGEAKVSKLQVMQLKANGKGSFPNAGDVEFSFETYTQTGSNQYKSLWQLHFNGKDYAHGVALNGNRGETKNSRGEKSAMPEANLTELKQNLYAESLDKLLPLTSPSLTVRTLGESQVDGRTVVGLVVTAKDRREVRLYFDKESLLLVKRENTVLDTTTGKLVAQESFFRNYKDFDGVKHWTHFEIRRGGARFLEGDVTEVKFFETLNDGVFTLP